MENTRDRINITVLFRILFWLLLYTAAGALFVYLSNTGRDGSKSVLADSASELPMVVIDAGHGGYDGGAVSKSGILEKEINLNIARKLEMLFSLSDIPCVLTRSEDIQLVPVHTKTSGKKRGDLIARAEICESYDNAVFVSIHQNKFPSSKYKGLQVFYSKNNPDSAKLAKTIMELNKALIDSTNAREAKGAGREIYVLDRLKAPAVLIECGFLSNEAEAKRLSSDEYQHKLALMIYSAVSGFIFGNCCSDTQMT